jgi:peptide deformylase
MREIMATLKIVQYPEAVLKKKAEPVSRFDEGLQRLIDDMFETLYTVPGIGLAAPQVGRSLQLFVYDLREDEKGPRRRGVVINPVLVEKSGEAVEDEGCLSVEGYREHVKRAARAVVTGLSRDGEEIRVEGEGLMARLLQHETDHLDGKLFVDRLSSLKRQMFLKWHKKQLRRGIEE